MVKLEKCYEYEERHRYSVRGAVMVVRRRLMPRLHYLFWFSELETLRWCLGWGSILWAVMLLWPGQLFPTPDQIIAGTGRQTYALMSEIAPEEVWGAGFLLQGVVMIWSLLLGYRTKITLWADAILGAFLWTASTFSCFASHYHGWSTYDPPAAMASEVVMTVASWWTLLRYAEVKKHG